MKLLGVISWVFGSEYTFTSLFIGKPNNPSKHEKVYIYIYILREKFNNLVNVDNVRQINISYYLKEGLI